MDGFEFDDGNWYACTLGEFISLLVDAGDDPAVMFRVVDDSECDADGKFVRKFELVSVPDGYVAATARKCKGIHKTLRLMIEGGAIR